jgi:SAM-dependent methyltransferase
MDTRAYYDGETLHVAAYDSFLEPPPRQIAGDVAFYVDVARAHPGPVLELGAGTGRVTLALAATGLTVIGLDLSAAMLAIAADKRAALAPDAAARVRFVAGDMRCFDLGARFAVALAPFRAFQCLLTPDDQMQALAAIRNHLAPGGTLVLQLFDPRLDLIQPGAPPPQEVQVGVHRRTGRRVDAVALDTALDPLAQVRRDTWRYREYDAGGAVVREESLVLTLRWTYRWELHHLLARCGFRVEAEFGDFSRAPPAYAKEMIVVATPAP